ncbi:MAG: S8 family serine peptidase, partial [Anaerolineales bacterium]|nr:S8 family serine peptidase [Anaerolineales bacterium]
SANAALSRDLNVSYEYGATLVGFAAEMTGYEAMQLEKLDGVLFVEKEKMSYPQTDAGPVWSGAADVWGGTWNSLSYKAEISGASEVPSVTTNVSGMGDFTYNFYTNELTYTINISNPDNVNLTAMHIHSATAGVNGGVIYNFNITPTSGDVSVTGVVTLTDDQEPALVNAGLYVNIHSDVNTAGEARGQIELNGTLGEGVIVGILDTGVDPWNPSFLAVGGDGYVHTNPLGEGNYLGVCDPSNAGGDGVVAYDPTFPCNSKLIGVWGYTASDPSPRDGDGHGSHTASTAAGNVVFDSVAIAPTQVFTADISGVAPHANIIAYDVCIDGGGCPGASLAAARDQALLDGVDVINYSIGSSAPTGDFWADAESLQWLALRDAGVFVATSNGNSGNGDATTGSPADTPWITSVGANSHNRAFLVTVALSDGVSTVEVSGQAMTSGYGPAPIVFSSDYLSGTEDARLCAPGAFPPGTFSGEIVVCERGIYGRVDKGQSALDGGAGGFILAQPDEATGGPGAVAADTHVLPAAHIDYYQYQILRQFVITDSVAAVSGTLSGASLDVDDSHGDIMAAFSSRGPNGTDADLIVPKVTAPGRAIWAAYHQGPGGDGDYTYNVIQGTSMASPHAAGAGALLSAAHPDWSPAQMESALMLTARDTVLNDDGINIATPFAQGSGHIAVGMAAMSPLVMDVSTAEYVASEPNDGDNFDVRDLNIASLGEDSCVAVCSWTRTVENVSSGTLTWTTSLTITAPATGTVQPATFTLAPGETQVITVSVDVSGNTPETDWVFGKVELDEDSGTYPDGHLPIAVYPASGNVPETLDIETQFTSGSVDLVDLLSIEITDLYTEATGMVFGELTTTSLPE